MGTGTEADMCFFTEVDEGGGIVVAVLEGMVWLRQKES